MAIQKVGWRPYVSPELSASTLLTSIYGVWNAEQTYTVTTLNTSVYGAWNGENTLNDSLGNYNGTNNGVTYTTGKVGSNAFNFNGSSYFTLANDALKFTGNFSISVWLKLNALGQTNTIVSSCATGANGFRFYVSNTNKLFFEYNGSYFTGVSTLTSATWYHIGLVNTGSSFRMYINGVLEATNVLSTAPGPYQTITWAGAGLNLAQFGKYANLAWYLNGVLDAITVWNRTLSDAEMNALYNSGNGCQYSFPSSISGTTNTFDDSVSSNHGSIAAYSNLPTFTTGKIGKSFLFDGINDHIALPTNILKKTGDFSFSVWVNANTLSGNQAIFGTYFYNTTTYGWRLDFVNSSMTFGIFGSSQVNLGVGGTFNIGQWYHITVTRKASTGTKVYVNGTLNVSNTSTINPNYATTQYTTIGATQYQPSAVTYYFNGKIDAVNVWDKELTASEVTDLYNSGNGKQYPNY